MNLFNHSRILTFSKIMKQPAVTAPATMIFTLSLVATATGQTAQSGNGPKTKLEAFQSQPGNVFIKGFSKIGRVDGVDNLEISSMEITDTNTGKKQMGVLVEIESRGGFQNSNTSFIDYDEIDSLLKGIDYLTKASPDVTKLDQFEVKYKTADSFSVTTFSSKSGEIKAVVECGDFQPASAFMSLQQLSDLRLLIEKAKQKLDSPAPTPKQSATEDN